MAEKCPNLTHLNLSGNKIKDLSTIEPLVSHGASPLLWDGRGWYQGILLSHLYGMLFVFNYVL